MQQITINIERRFLKEVASYNLEQISKACFYNLLNLNLWLKL